MGVVYIHTYLCHMVLLEVWEPWDTCWNPEVEEGNLEAEGGNPEVEGDNPEPEGDNLAEGTDQ